MLSAIKVSARKRQGKAAGSMGVMVSSKHSPTSSSWPLVSLSCPQGWGSPLSAHVQFTAAQTLKGDLEGGSGWGRGAGGGEVSPGLSCNLGTILESPRGLGSWQKINVGHSWDRYSSACVSL